MAKEKTSKKNPPADASSGFAFPDGKAQRMFREDPFSRLLLHAGMWAFSQDSAKAAQLANANAAHHYYGPNQYHNVNSSPALSIAKMTNPGSFERLFISINALQKHEAEWNHYEPGNNKPFVPGDNKTAKAIGGRSVARAVAEELAACSMSTDIPDERIDEFLALGRNSLIRAGCDMEFIDSLKDDSELCLAIHRLAFGGATELSCAPPDQSGWPVGILNVIMSSRRGGKPLHDSIFDVSFLKGKTEAETLEMIRSEKGRSDVQRDLSLASRQNDPLFPPGHPFCLIPLTEFSRDFGGFDFRNHKTILIGALWALNAPDEQRRKQARCAILSMTDTSTAKSSWERVGPSGDLKTVSQKPKETPTQQGPGAGGRFSSPHPAPCKRTIGAGARGDMLRTAIPELSEIISWKSTSKVAWHTIGPWAGDAIGQGTIKAILEEAELFNRHSKAAMALALFETSKDVKNRADFASLLATRVATGFSGIPNEPDDDDLLPGIDDMRAAKSNENKPLCGIPGELIKSEPMGAVAVAASKALGIESDDIRGLVGEAKSALATHAALSNAGWKSLAGSEALSQAFCSLVAETARNVSSGRRLPVRRAASEIIRAANHNGSGINARLFRIHKAEAKTLKVEAAGRALSAVAMSGIPEAPAERLLKFLAACKNAASIVAGRIPQIPQSSFSDGARGYRSDGEQVEDLVDDFPLRARAIADESTALRERAPNFAKCISERIEREIAKNIKNGSDPEIALVTAFNETSNRINDICDAASKLPVGFWGGLDRKDPLSAAMRLHDAWAQDNIRDQEKKNPELLRPWAPVLGVKRDGRMWAFELSSGKELFEEGRRMSHCVGSYSTACHNGSSRIFSLQMDGVPYSTLEIAPFDKKGERISSLDFDKPEERKKAVLWKAVQHRTKHNGSVKTSEVLEFAKTIEAAAGESFKAKTDEMNETCAKSEPQRPKPKAV